MPAADKPAAEVEIDEALVRALVSEQLPDLAELKLIEVASGWDNVIFRLGDELVVRLPRRALGAALVEHEQRWLALLADTLPLPIPTPVRIGQPGAGYPWSWSVCAWFRGDIAARTDPADPFEAAASLGRFVAALHQEAPGDAPFNPYRGGPLSDRDKSVSEWVERLHDTFDGPAVLARWHDVVATPPWAGPPLWLHGDLHPANVVVDAGRLSAVIDFGDITSGDPACDLAVAWTMFPVEARPMFRETAGVVDDDTWKRAWGWALFFGLAFLANSADVPLFARLGKRVLESVLSDTDLTDRPDVQT